jgi:geranylgeranyl diphosphate synthase, type II
MNFLEQLQEKQRLVNRYLEEVIEINGAPKSIIDSMRYSLLSGGKRIRPILAMSFCEALNGEIKEVLPFACAIEFIHTYSLIHDDLPAMDNDDLRRGRPTNHKVFGEAKAILAGDSLLNYAFEIMLSEVVKKQYSSKFVEAAKVISSASGVRGMIGGQVIDIESEGTHLSIDTLIDMHSKKTGALIEASCLCGCIIANRQDIIDKVIEYSKCIGITFQIVDDILDYTGDINKLGKNTGSDAANNKSTFVSILGIDESRKMAEKYTETARVIAGEIDGTGFLIELTNYLLHREY